MRFTELANTCLGSLLERFEIFEGLPSVSVQYIAVTTYFTQQRKKKGTELKKGKVGCSSSPAPTGIVLLTPVSAGSGPGSSSDRW